MRLLQIAEMRYALVLVRLQQRLDLHPHLMQHAVGLRNTPTSHSHLHGTSLTTARQQGEHGYSSGPCTT